MKFLIVLAVAGCALARHPGFDVDGRPMNRIVGGVEVNPPGKYPFMVQLPVGCGGSLISPDWVLTAAHCVEDNPNDPPANGPLWLERHDANSGGFSVNVTEIIINPTYGNPQDESDTALLRISPVVDRIRPIPLDSGKGIFSQPGELNTVIGWGWTSQNRASKSGPDLLQYADKLQEVALPVISNEVCKQAMDSVFPGVTVGVAEICMGRPEGGMDACNGDSGGPMFYQNGNNIAQTGVVSWGDGCARPNRYGVYARVSAVIDWIVENVPGAVVV